MQWQSDCMVLFAAPVEFHCAATNGGWVNYSSYCTYKAIVSCYLVGLYSAQDCSPLTRISWQRGGQSCQMLTSKGWCSWKEINIMYIRDAGRGCLDRDEKAWKPDKQTLNKYYYCIATAFGPPLAQPDTACVKLGSIVQDDSITIVQRWKKAWNFSER